MALLNKLFSPRKVNKNVVCDLKQDIASFRPFSIKKEDVRVLLFKDCDRNGRKLLFDSSTVEIVPLDCANKSFHNEFSKFCQNPSNDKCDNTLPNIVEVSDGFAYQFKPTANDGGQLGEMIFGTVALNYHGVSLKFHILNEPQRLMCAKVFGIPSKINNQYSRTEHNVSASDLPCNSPKQSQWSSLALPLDATPLKSDSGYSLSFSFSRGDSGFLYDRSPRSSMSSSYVPDGLEIWDHEDSHSDLSFDRSFPISPRLNSASSGSFNRRLQRNMSTRLEPHCLVDVPQHCESNQAMVSSRLDSKSCVSPHATTDSLISCNSSTSSKMTRRIKLGLAIIISLAERLEMDMLRYFLQHSPQLESMLMRLATAVTATGMSKHKRKSSRTGGGFVSAMVLAVNDIVQGLLDLVNGPRVPSLWLNLMSAKDVDKRKHELLEEQFITNLSLILTMADTKETNFFISTLMTSLLTHHLGWVATVSPYEMNDCPNKDPWHVLTVKHPYNPLWAQLGDLYGGLTTPLKTSRTILCGTNNTYFMTKLLSILTYFIRCGSVRTHLFETNQFSSRDDMFKISPKINIHTNENNEKDHNDNTISNDICTDINSKPKKCIGLKKAQSVAVKLNALDVMSDDFTRFDTLHSESNIVDTVENGQSTLFGCNVNEETPLIHCTSDNHTNSRDIIQVPLCSNLSAIMEEIDKETSSVKRHTLSVETVSDNNENNVLFVLGDNEKLIGLKNKTKDITEIVNSNKNFEIPSVDTQLLHFNESAGNPEITQSSKSQLTLSPSTSDICSVSSCHHSKSKKHSGVKFEFDKYPQIVANYLKSKNLEWLDRNYIGKPGNIKINDFDFEPSTSLTMMENSHCEQCSQCNSSSSGFLLQTPSNASELEFTSDLPSECDYQHAKENIVEPNAESPEIAIPKTFVRCHLENTVIVNVYQADEEINCDFTNSEKRDDDFRENTTVEFSERESCDINFIEVPFVTPKKDLTNNDIHENSFDCTLLGDVTDRYIPDIIIQGILSTPEDIEYAVRRELSLCSQGSLPLNQGPSQAVALIADTQRWCVQVWDVEGTGYEGVFSPLVAGIFDVLPIMIQSKTSPRQCITFIESKLRELCTRSKTLAELLLSTDFCDMAYLTRALNIDSNDVPLLMAIATTHTPQISLKYGVSFR